MYLDYTETDTKYYTNEYTCYFVHKKYTNDWKRLYLFFLNFHVLFFWEKEKIEYKYWCILAKWSCLATT
jgi:hypothetical protein